MIDLPFVHVVELTRGGVTTALADLVRAQHAHGDFREIVILADRGKFDSSLRELPARIELYESQRHPPGIVQGITQVRRHLAKIGPCVVYAHSTFAGLFGRMAMRTLPGPFATIYCSHGWAFTQEVDPARKSVYAAIERSLARRTDLSIHISHSERREAMRRRVVARRDVVIYHGVRDVQNADAPSIETKQDKINIGFIGRFDHQKGGDLLVEMLRRKLLTHHHFWFLGDAVRRKSHDYDAIDGISFTGWVPNAMIDSYLCRMDAVVMPSRWEGFGLVAIEAMRNGIPVIVSDRGALPELVIDGYNGRIASIDDFNSFASLLEGLDKAGLGRMGKNARTVYEQCFTLGDAVDKYRAEIIAAAAAKFGNAR